MNGEHEPEPDREEAEPGQREARQAMDRLNESNRVLMEARMLPRAEKLTEQQTKEVIERYKTFIALHGISAVQVAREVGYSAAALSEWAASRYKANPDTITHAVNDWMEREGRRQQARRPKDYVKTWIAEDVRTYAYLADKRCMMAAIVVPAGAGKTMVLKTLTEEMRGLYVYCLAGMTELDLLRSIADSLGWDQVHASKGSLRRFIIEKLTGTHRIIFLDEAHQLGAKLGAIRGIHDEAHVPIVMAGTDEILRFVNDRAHGRGQFSSRCIRYNALDYVHNAEAPEGGTGGRDLFTVEEIRAFFAMKKIRLDRDGLNMLWALACLPNYGTLRLVENTIDTVFDLEPELELVTRDHVIEALKALVGSEAVYLQRLARRHAERNAAELPVAKAG